MLNPYGIRALFGGRFLYESSHAGYYGIDTEFETE